MHQPAHRGMQLRHRRVQSLHPGALYEREPAWFTVPWVIPSIPVLSPLLDPLITPIVVGLPRTTSTSTSPHTTSTTQPAQAPTPAPTTTTPSDPPPAAPTAAHPNTSNAETQTASPANPTGNNPATESSGSPSTTSPSSPSPSDSAGAGGNSPSSGATNGFSAQPQPLAEGSTSGAVINANGGQAFISGTGAGSAGAAQETASTGNGSNVPSNGRGGTSTVHGSQGTGTTSYYPGYTSTAPGSDPTDATGKITAATNHGPPTGLIAAISVIAIFLAFLLLLCCVRRRAILARMRRRKQWYAGTAVAGAADSEKEYSDKDGLRSGRSSFATNYDRGQMLFTPAPDFDPFSPVEPVTHVWPSTLDGSITVPPASHAVSSASSPTIRSAPDRSSIHSTSSSGSSRPSSQGHDYLVALPPAAVTDGSRPSLDSPFSVRPFSPSETFSFPKPPQDDAQSRAASEILSSSVKSSRRGSAYFTAETPSAEIENPFADFTEIVGARPPSVSTENSVPQHFAAVELIRRPFVPSMDDELAVNPGDEVRILKRFDDGWAVAEKIGAGAQGLIPIDCMRAVEEELPAFLAKKRISSYRARSSVVTRASVLSGGSSVGAAV